MHGNDFSLALPVFPALDNPSHRARDLDVLGDLSGLLKWVTADPDARPYWLRKAGVIHRLEQEMAKRPCSNWSIRKFLAEVGHSDLRVTLTSYIHDPVVPFVRWFEDPALPLDAARITAAVGRARDARAREAAAGKEHQSRSVRSRIAHLIADAPYTSEVTPQGTIEFPSNLDIDASCVTRIDPTEVAAMLSLVARGMPLAAAATTCHWSAGPTASLEAVLGELSETYRIDVLGTPGEAAKGRVPLSPPRNLEDDGGLPALLKDPKASDVLAQVFEAWVEGLGWGVSPAKVAASPKAWAQWEAAVPLLASLPWERTNQGAARSTQMLRPGEKGSLGLWPTLRWVMACAGISRRISP
jgi:hypothetical protein